MSSPTKNALPDDRDLWKSVHRVLPRVTAEIWERWVSLREQGGLARHYHPVWSAIRQVSRKPKNLMNKREEILKHMSRAFFASAWADWSDEYGEGTQGNGVNVMDEMPRDIDPSAVKAARRLVKSLEALHGKSIVEIYERACIISQDDGDRDKTPEMFGHYAAMGAMGHGVSLYDAFGRAAAEFVNTQACSIEFSPADLDPCVYPS